MPFWIWSLRISSALLISSTVASLVVAFHDKYSYMFLSTIAFLDCGSSAGTTTSLIKSLVTTLKVSGFRDFGLTLPGFGRVFLEFSVKCKNSSCSCVGLFLLVFLDPM